MKQAPARGGAVRSMFIFLLLGLFALLATFLVLLGARVYRGTVQQDTMRGQRRVLDSYVRSMVASGDREGAFGTAEEEGISVLYTRIPTDEGAYIRRLYCYDGSLRESFSSEDRPFEPQNGETLCAADHFSAGIEGNILTVNAVSGGEEMPPIRVAIRTPQ